VSDMIAWIAAEAEPPAGPGGEGFPLRKRRTGNGDEEKSPVERLVAHQFPAKSPLLAKCVRNGAPGENPHPSKSAKGGAAEAVEPSPGSANPGFANPGFANPGFANKAKGGAAEGHEPASPELSAAEWLLEQAREQYREDDRQRRAYRGRTVAMLRRYMKYSIETGRLPSLLGREFFRAKVTSYQVVTFEERVIFVHDMETCLERLDEFSRQLIARHILQEHDRWATARLLHCNEKTVRRLVPLVLDTLSEILLERGMLEKLDSIEKKPCQGGLEGKISVSACEDRENKF
jgi:hypothetical protein